jgi:hypothetical protein
MARILAVLDFVQGLPRADIDTGVDIAKKDFPGPRDNASERGYTAAP